MVYFDSFARTYDGRWYFIYSRNGRLLSSFHTFATKAEAKAACDKLISSSLYSDY